MRWRHPEHDMVRPDVFIPIAEKTDALPALTDWLLQRMSVETRKLPGLDDKVLLAVNIGPSQLAYGSGSAADEVDRRLRDRPEPVDPGDHRNLVVGEPRPRVPHGDGRTALTRRIVRPRRLRHRLLVVREHRRSPREIPEDRQVLRALHRPRPATRGGARRSDRPGPTSSRFAFALLQTSPADRPALSATLTTTPKLDSKSSPRASRRRTSGRTCSTVACSTVRAGCSRRRSTSPTCAASWQQPPHQHPHRCPSSTQSRLFGGQPPRRLSATPASSTPPCWKDQTARGCRTILRERHRQMPVPVTLAAKAEDRPTDDGHALPSLGFVPAIPGFRGSVGIPFIPPNSARLAEMLGLIMEW